jgi:hypothetical protein
MFRHGGFGVFVICDHKLMKHRLPLSLCSGLMLLTACAEEPSDSSNASTNVTASGGSASSQSTATNPPLTPAAVPSTPASSPNIPASAPNPPASSTGVQPNPVPVDTGTAGAGPVDGTGGVGAGGANVGAAGAEAGGASGAADSGGADNAGGADTGNAGTGGSAGMNAGGESTGGTGGAVAESPLPPIEDYSEDGPFEVIVEEEVGPNDGYVVFRPTTLGENGFLHAPIIFGPGIGQSVMVHEDMLSIFASHGFVVVGTPVLEGGPGDPGNLQLLEDGLDWVLGQNEAGGAYEGVLDVTHAVSMGFSVGGTAAVELGGHEAVATVVSIHGHSATAALHGPMLQTTGTEDGLGMDLQDETYAASEVPTFLATLTGAPHSYIEQNAGGEQRPAIVAWMRYFIYNDVGARDYFYGDDCVLCMEPWENPRRKNWE